MILKLSSLTHLKKININMNLSIQRLTFCLLFFIFYQKKHFKNYEKLFLFPLTSTFLSWDFQYFVFFPFSFQFLDSKGQTKIFANMFYNSKRKITSTRRFLFFDSFVHKKGQGAKEKIKLPFSYLLPFSFFLNISNKTCL